MRNISLTKPVVLHPQQHNL